jgi:hypothetical protein
MVDIDLKQKVLAIFSNRTEHNLHIPGKEIQEVEMSKSQKYIIIFPLVHSG